MSDFDFLKLFPHLDNNVQWYLNEIKFCLERYVGMEEESSVAAILACENITGLIKDDPNILLTEDGYYWAMGITHGFDSAWWTDDTLAKQHQEYIKERHHPPRFKN